MSTISYKGVRIKYSARRKYAVFSIDYDGVILNLPKRYSWSANTIIDKNSDIVRKLEKQVDTLPKPPAEPTYEIGGIFRLLGNDYPLQLDQTLGSKTRFEDDNLYTISNCSEDIKREIDYFYREFARNIVTDKVARLADFHGITYNRIRITSASTRWGSCSAKGNLNFTWKLIFAPEPVIDYVIAHELAHRKEMNHSKNFWREVAKLCPNYRVWRKEMRKEEIYLKTY